MGGYTNEAVARLARWTSNLSMGPAFHVSSHNRMTTPSMSASASLMSSGTRYSTATGSVTGRHLEGGANSPPAAGGHPVSIPKTHRSLPHSAPLSHKRLRHLCLTFRPRLGLPGDSGFGTCVPPNPPSTTPRWSSLGLNRDKEDPAVLTETLDG
jgi:hypothetical protein